MILISRTILCRSKGMNRKLTVPWEVSSFSTLFCFRYGRCSRNKSFHPNSLFYCLGIFVFMMVLFIYFSRVYKPPMYSVYVKENQLKPVVDHLRPFGVWRTPETAQLFLYHWGLKWFTFLNRLGKMCRSPQEEAQGLSLYPTPLLPGWKIRVSMCTWMLSVNRQGWQWHKGSLMFLLITILKVSSYLGINFKY